MRRHVATLLAAVALLSPLAHPSSAKGTGCPRSAGAAWSSAELPSYPNRYDKPAPVYTPPGTATFLVAADAVWATNGEVVVRSSDAGCHWTLVYRLPGTVATTANNPSSVITELAFAGGQVLALLEGASRGAVPTLTVLRLSGRTGVEARGLPALGQPVSDDSGVPRRLITSPTHPLVVYLASCSPTPLALCPSATLYGSIDGGVNFTARGPLPHTADLYGGLVAIDPLDARHLWGITGTPDPVQTSRDGGVTWTPVGPTLHGLRDLQVRTASGRTQLLGIDSDGTLVRSSVDGGRTWSVDVAPIKVTGLTVNQDAAALLGASPTGAVRVLRWQVGTHRFTDITPAAEFRGLLQASSGLWGLAKDRLWHSAIVTTLKPGSGAPSSMAPPTAPALTGTAVRGGGQLLPARQSLKIPLAGTRTADLSLVLPVAPGAAQIGFLLDATGSMESADHDLARAFGIISEQQSGASRFALATFGEYPLRQYGGTDPGFNIPYERLTALVPNGPDLRSAFGRIRSTGGSIDTRTSALPALEQALTGSGRRVDQPGGSRGADLAAGQQLGFSGSGLRVLFLATDSQAHEPPGYPGPSVATVVGQLRRAGVLLVGLDVAGGGVPGTGFLRALAVGSGAVAPQEGVDCDGDGRVDLLAGEPLVCPVGSAVEPAAVGAGLARAVDNLLAALPQPQTVAVTAQSATLRVSVAPLPVSDTHLRGVSLPVRVTVRCPSEFVTEHVILQAVFGGLRVARATAEISCVAPAVMSSITPPGTDLAGMVAPVTPLLGVGAAPPAAVPLAPPPALPAPGVLTQPAPGAVPLPAAVLQRQAADAPALAYTAAAQDQSGESSALGLLAVELTFTAGMSALALGAVRTRTSPISRNRRS